MGALHVFLVSHLGTALRLCQEGQAQISPSMVQPSSVTQWALASRQLLFSGKGFQSQ